MAGVYSPTSYFFTENVLQPTTFPNDQFGPVVGQEAFQYRVTSKVRSSTPNTKVFAICDGRIKMEVCTEDSTKINMILKPNNAYTPLKIKYFIYRGINKSDLIDGDNLKQKNITDASQPIFLQKMWDAFYKKYSLDTPFTTRSVGYDESQSESSLIDSYFYNTVDSADSFTLPNCSAGDHIGNFSAFIGLDIILDEGDHELINEPNLFKFDLSYARKIEYILDINSIQSPTQVNIKRYREYIQHFIDAAAFWGSHINNGAIKHPDGSLFDKASVCTNILAKYYTGSKCYIYIRNEQGRSYNFYDDNKMLKCFSGNLQKYETSGWPILIKEVTNISSENTTQQIILQYEISSTVDPSDAYVYLDVVAPGNNTAQYPLAEHIISLTDPVPDLNNPSQTVSIGDISPVNFNTAVWAQKSCSNFLFINSNLRRSVAENYFDFLWPVNFDSVLKEPVDSNNAITLLKNSVAPNLKYWAVNDKSRLINLKPRLDTTGVIQNKIVSGNGDAQNKRRLFIATMKRNTNHEDNYEKLNVTSITAGFSKNNQSVDQYMFNVYQDRFFYTLRGQFMEDGNTINSLELSNIQDYGKKASFFQLGITEDEYNKLLYDNSNPPAGATPQTIPADAANVFLDLIPVTINSSDEEVKKYRLGLKYEDSTGKTATNISQTFNNPVFVYTFDGFYFFSKDFSFLEPFAVQYPQMQADFRPRSDFNGEYGFDWLRIGDSGLVTDRIYKGHVGKLYKDRTFTTLETLPNEFEKDYFKASDSMFQKLEAEYRPFFSQGTDSTVFTKYYVPILSLYPPYVESMSALDHQSVFNPNDDSVNRVANMKLKFNIKVKPSKIDIQYDITKLNLVFGEIPTSTGKHQIDVTINWKNEFGTEQLISVVAYYPNQTGGADAIVVGALRVKPNSKLLRKSYPVLLCPVITGLSTSPTPTQAALNLKKFLRQAFITPIIKVIPIDVSKLDSFVPYITSVESDSGVGSEVAIINDSRLTHPIPAITVQRYLENLLEQQKENGVIIGGKYNDYYKLFLFSEKGVYVGSDGLNVELAGSTEFNTVLTAVYKRANSTTATHEVLHSLKLPHSFNNSEVINLGPFAKFTYEPQYTYNIMDYVRKVDDPVLRLTIWDWQARLANQASKNPEP